MTEWLEQKPFRPHEYQREAVKFLLGHSAAALLMDPGLGKTAITLAAIKVLKDKGLFHRGLVVAPLRVCHGVWPRELEKWSDFNGLTMEVLHGPKKQKALDRGSDICVINPEGLAWLTGAKKKGGRGTPKIDIRRWLSHEFDLLVLDELTRWKHTDTARFKLAKQIIPTFSRRWGLTGSPTASGIEGLFGQMFMLDEGNALGHYVTQFRRKYFIEGWNAYDRVLRPGAEEEVYEAIRPLSLRMGDDLLDMPERIENFIWLDLPEELKGTYAAMERDLIVKIEEGTVTAANAAVASSKLRQIANGFLFLDDDVAPLTKLPSKERAWQDLHDLKLDALEGLVEELQGSPLLVPYEFKPDLAKLHGRFGKDVPYIGGGVTTRQTRKIEDAWNAGDIPLLLGQPQSMGLGLNLQAAGNHVAWYAMTWSFELYDQTIRRVLRQGNEHEHVFVHHLLVRDTVDAKMLDVSRQNDSSQQALFKALQK